MLPSSHALSAGMHALFVSPLVATQLGAVYLCLRVLYPVIWAIVGGKSGVPTKPYSLLWPLNGLGQIYTSTFPQYGIVFYLAFATVAKLALGLSLNTLVIKPVLFAPIACGLALYHCTSPHAT